MILSKVLEDHTTRRMLIFAVGAFVVMWALAHMWMLAFIGGLALGYLLGRGAGRRKAIVETAREIVRAHARRIGDEARHEGEWVK